MALSSAFRLLKFFFIISNLFLSTEGTDKNKCDAKCEKAKKDAAAVAAKPTDPPVPKTAKFNEWQTWEVQFPQCNPKINPNLSPINIDTKSAEVLKDVQTLIVYSGSPTATAQGAFTFSSFYATDGVRIEAISIGLRNEYYRDATYVAGLGNPEYRFFQRALILFSNKEVESERSLHQIDGKKFIAEIVLLFVDLRNTDMTQIHVMVERKEEINPIWHWLPDAVLMINQGLSDAGIDENEKVTSAKVNQEEAKKEYDVVLEQEKKETGEDGYEATYQDLKVLYDLVKESTDTNELEQKKVDISAKLATLAKMEPDLQQAKKDQETKLWAQQEKIQNWIAQGLRTAQDRDGETDILAELKDAVKNLTDSITSLQKSWLKNNRLLYDVTNKLNKEKGLLKQYKIGPGKDDTFKDIKEVKHKMEHMEEKVNELVAARDSYEAAVGESENALAQEPQSVYLKGAFQISWLLPPMGGYYTYNGSGVVPPCKKRTHVIVMEHPVSMSKEQFDILSSVRKGKTREEMDYEGVLPDTEAEKVDQIVPPKREVGKRKIYFNQKNLQFKLDDGLHMKSSIRRKIKDSMKKSEATRKLPKIYVLLLHFIICFILRDNPLFISP